MRSVFIGDGLDSPKIRCKENVKSIFSEYITIISSKRVISEKEAIEQLENGVKDAHFSVGIGYINLFWDVFNIRKSGKVESNFSQASLLFTDCSIDKDLFFLTGKIVLDVLKQSVTPISIFRIIVEAKKKEENICKDYVDLCCSSFPEILNNQSENSDLLYKVRIDKLSAAADMAERVLFERGKSTHIDELVSEINRQLYLVNSDRYINKTAILSQLRQKKHIVCKGKTGIYSFREWEENTENLNELIRKAIIDLIWHNYLILRMCIFAKNTEYASKLQRHPNRSPMASSNRIKSRTVFQVSTII